MGTQGSHMNEDAGRDAPEGLVDGLRLLYGHTPSVPSAVDDAVLRAAGRRLTRHRPTLALRWAAVCACPLLIVAALVVVVSYVAPRVRPEPLAAAVRDVAPVVSAREDLNADGRVDILDAFLLAKRVDGGSEPTPTHDLNADGRVDRLDVDLIAMAAVRLNGGTS